MGTISRTTRDNWSMTGDPCGHTLVRLDELKIDVDHYQRGEKSKDNTKSIAIGFNWASFGSIVVGVRRDGTKWVVDGHQRVCAARLRGDIDRVPAQVFFSQGPSHEAEVFLTINSKRAKVSAVAKFRAAANAGSNPDRSICDWLASIGLRVDNDSKARHVICFPSVLIKTWLIDEESTKKAIEAQQSLIASEVGTVGSCSDIHNGFWWLIRRDVNLKAEIPKLIERGGRQVLLSAMRSLAAEMGTTISEAVAGKAVLKVINFRRRNRISVDDAGAA